MQCDEKRTIFALKQCISDSTIELQEAENQLKTEENNEKRLQIQTKINDLEKTIHESNDQLLSMKLTKFFLKVLVSSLPEPNYSC